MHAQESYMRAPLPIFSKQRADFFEDLGVDLRGPLQCMRAGESRKILVAQLELDGSRVQPVFAQATPYHLRQPGQRGFKNVRVGGVFSVSMLVADGFRIRT